jgi:hypothetical protein
MKTNLLLICVSLVVGCATQSQSAHLPSGSWQSLTQRGDFDQARTCAKEWVRAALHLIEEQDERIKELEIKR